MQRVNSAKNNANLGIKLIGGAGGGGGEDWMAWPEFGHIIYFLIWHNLFPFLVSGEGGEGL